MRPGTIAVLIIALSLLTLPVVAPGERIQPEDLTYQGAFRLPETFNWGARGMAFYPPGQNGGTLLVTGFEAPSPGYPPEVCWNPSWNCYAYYGQVAIPTPVVDSNWENLPEATLIGDMVPFDDGLVAATVNRDNTFVSDIQYLPQRGAQTSDKIYGSIEIWYAEGVFGENTFPTVWMANLDGSGARGVFHVGPEEAPYHGRKMGSYLFTVPQWYADQYLGGRILVTGRSRGTPATAVDPVTIEGGSQGPTLFAFRALETDNPTGNLDALPLLYYRVKFPGCAGPNVGDPAQCDYPGFTMCDEWTGAAFVERGTRQAILLLGYKGLGGNCYDEPPVVCDDPCSDAHGYHCYPYERQVIFYDVADLGRTARGEQDPWSVVPYRIWRPSEFYFQGATCWNAGGMAFDPGQFRLFMVERGFAGDTNRTVVHVWQVKDDTPTSIYVDPAGLCSGRHPCYRELAEAIEENSGNIRLHIREGTYPENLTLTSSRTVELYGGYNADYSEIVSYSQIRSLAVSGGTAVPRMIRISGN